MKEKGDGWTWRHSRCILDLETTDVTDWLRVRGMVVREDLDYLLASNYWVDDGDIFCEGEDLKRLRNSVGSDSQVCQTSSHSSYSLDKSLQFSRGCN